MRELIERQAAVDALMEAVKSVGVLDADDIKTVFDMLPSVQHEKEQLSKEGATKDTISRQASLEKVRAMQTYKLFMGDDMILVDKAEVQTELMMLPSLPTEPQWIPIAERLPKDGTWNIFTDGKNISVERYKADAIDHFFPNGRWFQLEDVIAWMPLPEPYKPNNK